MTATRKTRPTKQFRLDSMDSFTRSYLECALWSSTDESDESGGEPMDAAFDECDVSNECLDQMISDCREFQAEARALLDAAEIDDAQAGHDFWLTRNGHGAGFWDRGLGEVGEQLSDMAHAWGSVDLYVYRGRVFSN